MKTGRWLDHLPPWLAWGAVASTGAYSGVEAAAMAIPLLAAAAVEWRGASLHRFRRLLELVALGVFLFQVGARTGVLPTVVNTLFALCGVRLCLPRELPQRRQLLLMGFLLFLTTAVSTSELDFLAWSLAWAAGGGLYLMQLNWEQSAQLRGGPQAHPPYRRILGWTGAAMVMAAGFFVVLPRLRTGMRSLPLAVHSMGGLRAGLSDTLDLGESGAVLGNSEVVMRIIPAQPAPGFAGAFGLLRGMVLEDLEGQRWTLADSTPASQMARWRGNGRFTGQTLRAEIYLSPSELAVIPLPYGRANLDPPPGEQLRNGPGASIRWLFPIRRTLSVSASLEPMILDPEPPPAGARLEFLTNPGRNTESALRWSLLHAPGDLDATTLAVTLVKALHGFRYTLGNPSGSARNPLQDFLERSQAGHCEFFASALAIMLRHRGVAARVVNGYRLGPWLQEGGYYLVTQQEAHSWVEFYDPLRRGWRPVDPTPPAPPSGLTAGSLLASFERMADTIRFRWDRNVVRFSDDDQSAGFDWLQAHLQALARYHRVAVTAAAALAGLAALAWALRRVRGRAPAPGSAGAVREIRPLLRAAGRALPPRPGETALAWLTRLGQARPDRAGALAGLARETDAVAYGGKPPTALARLARAEARAWKHRNTPGT